MGKQSKPRKPEAFGKGKVTPIQIAFIVDRYLCDNNYSETRSIFRNEASSLIANSPMQEAPKTLLSLGEMLDEYICLKEQKVILDQERVRMDQEKYRVQMLLQGMQNVMTAYNASGNLPGPAPNLPAPAAKSMAPQPQITNKSPSGIPTPMQSTMNIQTRPQSTITQAEATHMMNPSDRKRKDTKAVDAPSAAKKTRGRSSVRKIPSLGPNTLPQSDNAANDQVVAQPSCAGQSSPDNCMPNGTQVQGSTVAKCLFNEPSHAIPTNSPILKTPPRANSSHSDTHVSPPEISSVANRNKSHASREITPTRCTVISTKRVMVSPAKQMAYIERRHCISPLKPESEKTSKREHVRSRLDFDGSDMPESLDKPLSNDMSTSESDKEIDMFDIDFPNLDALGMDFSFTEMLGELDFHCEGIDFSCDPTSNLSEDNASGPSNEGDQTNQVTSELSPSAAVLSEKEMSAQGPDCLTAMKSVTKCITILSPVKDRQRLLDQEDPARD
ncbi:uncharacterized protein LOC114739583 [Neltuma alba]|uniref:uncharacterized protein LOC114739583 n=1 Tax=Neltuma alba TaxID=207710 RepID=UPI0010A57FFD|nr:uncharacterized protein LOC114739583 [Prosopis alba]